MQIVQNEMKKRAFKSLNQFERAQISNTLGKVYPHEFNYVHFEI